MLPSSPYGSGCLSPEGDGLKLAISVPCFVLCAVLVVSYVRAFRVVAIPQSGMLAQVSSLWLHSGHSGPILKKHCSPRLPSQPPLASGGCRHLRWLLLHRGSYLWARNLLVLIIYLFFFPVMLLSVLPRFATDLAVRVFPGVQKLLSVYDSLPRMGLPSWDGATYLPILSHFSSFIFFPTCF